MSFLECSLWKNAWTIKSVYHVACTSSILQFCSYFSFHWSRFSSLSSWKTPIFWGSCPHLSWYSWGYLFWDGFPLACTALDFWKSARIFLIQHFSPQAFCCLFLSHIRQCKRTVLVFRRVRFLNTLIWEEVLKCWFSLYFSWFMEVFFDPKTHF